MVVLRYWGLWREKCMECVNVYCSRSCWTAGRRTRPAAPRRQADLTSSSQNVCSVAGTRRLVWRRSPLRNLSRRARRTSASTPLQLWRQSAGRRRSVTSWRRSVEIRLVVDWQLRSANTSSRTMLYRGRALVIEFWKRAFCVAGRYYGTRCPSSWDRQWTLPRL